MNPQLICFDLDGVLVDSDGLHSAAFWSAVTDVEPHAFSTGGIPEELSTSAKLDRLGIKNRVSRDEIKRMKDLRFADSIPQIKFQGTLRYDLRRLRDRYRGVKLAVVSNCTDPNFDRILEHAGLLDGFNFYIHPCDSTERPKPDPYLYHQALYCAGCAPENAIVFEDSDNGVAAGKAAGIANTYKTSYEEMKARLMLCAF